MTLVGKFLELEHFDAKFSQEYFSSGAKISLLFSLLCISRYLHCIAKLSLPIEVFKPEHSIMNKHWSALEHFQPQPCSSRSTILQYGGHSSILPIYKKKLRLLAVPFSFQKSCLFKHPPQSSCSSYQSLICTYL